MLDVEMFDFLSGHLALYTEGSPPFDTLPDSDPRSGALGEGFRDIGASMSACVG